MKTLSASLGTIIVAVAVITGTFFGGWWLYDYSVNREASIRQDSYGRQTAIVDAINDDIAEAQSPNVPDAQRKALVATICDNAGKLTGNVPLPSNSQTFIAKECP